MYEKRIIAFVDILGFANLIKNSANSGVENAEITNNINSFINRMHRDLDVGYAETMSSLDISKEEAKKIKGTKIATQFSDSIVISFDYRQPSEVFHVILDLLFLSLSAIEHGFLLRGGVSNGLVRHTDKELFGPAMVDAYILESKIAKNPRIILSEEIIDIGIRFRRDSNSKSEEKDFIHGLLKQDEDGYYYVDFFDAIEYELDDPEIDYATYLDKLKRIIQEGSRDSAESVQLKMEWMKKRYNESLRRKKQQFEGLETDNEEWLALKEHYCAENDL